MPITLDEGRFSDKQIFVHYRQINAVERDYSLLWCEKYKDDVVTRHKSLPELKQALLQLMFQHTDAVVFSCVSGILPLDSQYYTVIEIATLIRIGDIKID